MSHHYMVKSEAYHEKMDGEKESEYLLSIIECHEYLFSPGIWFNAT